MTWTFLLVFRHSLCSPFYRLEYVAEHNFKCCRTCAMPCFYCHGHLPSHRGLQSYLGVPRNLEVRGDPKDNTTVLWKTDMKPSQTHKHKSVGPARQDSRSLLDSFHCSISQTHVVLVPKEPSDHIKAPAERSCFINKVGQEWNCSNKTNIHLFSIVSNSHRA